MNNIHIKKMQELYFWVMIFILSALTVSCTSKENKAEEKPLPYSVVKKMHRNELLEWNKNIVEFDAEMIRKFIERRRWHMEMSASGLYYQIYHKTNDIKAEIGLIAVFNYKISLLDGTVLYSSDVDGPRNETLGKMETELGLHEGLMMLRKGEKARFICPPHLAFGVPGDGYKVPYNSILVYEIELIDLVKPEIKEEENINGWI
ncbi:MAG: FKBP-type peptidyl-prolyl cis-trans isomerase [Bacteroidales bacterium]|jgi:FKBP-type peptidyl-prolyl cis-trans isomerase|nr:FKBP-type peptidyl-prolyl cis-trans isomerase [Bacteroidales bacterium]HOL96976.1 FKBP-type peptidyl-prolyl cis-trans isomerase [Bacteroidales bacterium]HOM36489.1 FKBP-type peptidyl-prolyl cis-trans isomerase [Bacteroidales bacterium]HPD24000.1 FKBP-type peptidyl-prolyl cis-trans isomerase [Bacteroidales bacterium]HRS98533.1 FKBP-type peptidyl-prolyl cis-trans isomerase [Bacteroidales bacterium]